MRNFFKHERDFSTKISGLTVTRLITVRPDQNSVSQTAGLSDMSIGLTVYCQDCAHKDLGT